MVKWSQGYGQALFELLQFNDSKPGSVEANVDGAIEWVTTDNRNIRYTSQSRITILDTELLLL